MVQGDSATYCGTLRRLSSGRPTAPISRRSRITQGGIVRPVIAVQAHSPAAAKRIHPISTSPRGFAPGRWAACCASQR